MRSQARGWLLTFVCGLALAAAVPAAAQAIGIEKFVATNCQFGAEECGQEKIAETEEIVLEKGAPVKKKFQFFEPNEEVTVGEAEKEGFVTAGGRVPFGITDFKLASEGAYPERIPTAATTHIRTDVAPGLATNPFAVPRCSLGQFGGGPLTSSGLFEAPGAECKNSVIGIQEATIYTGKYPTAGFGDVPVSGKVYDLVPAEGERMANGSHLASLYGVAVELPKFLTEAELKAHFEKEPIPEEAFPGTKAEKEAAKKATEKALTEKQWYSHSLIKGNVEWGKEARGTNVGDYHDYFEITTEPSPPLLRSRLTFEGTIGTGDFITNATSCPGNLTTNLTLAGVGLLGPEAGKAGSTRSPFTTPIGLTKKSCEELEFPVTFAFKSATPLSDQPNEFTAEASEEHEPEETDVSQVKSASFTLPEGMTLNPSAAHGLEACKPSQAHEIAGTEKFTEEFGVACPAASKIGSVTLNVPTLPNGSLTGSAYLGGPESGPITSPPYTMYVVANSEQYGISVRLVAHVIPNPVTGQVVTVFSSPPEQPFSNLAVHFERGVLAPVANPLVCGTPTGTSSFEPTSAPGTAKAAAFGVSITGCAATLPFALTQTTANQTTTAGGHTSYTFNLGRGDGNQYVSELKTELPPGLVGEIPKVTLCGEPQAAAGTCSAASQIGTAAVLAGSGPTPFAFSGPVYLTTSYNGAPYGLSIAVPAVAGPFNLGTVVTRASITVNPATAQVIADSVLPRVFKGIPLRLRNITVAVNKQGFLLNPTSCTTPMNTSTLLSGFTLNGGPVTATQTLTNGFPALTNCSALKFKPTFKASTSSKTSRVNGASLTTTITQPGGESNIKGVKVQLPRQLPSRLTTLQKACTQQVFAQNPKSCPSGSFVGGATVETPTLPGKLTGPAILVSHAGASFPDLDLVVESASHVRVILTGNTDIKHGVTTTNFASTPDVPVKKVTVNLPVGSHSALAAFGNLCAQPLVMPTTITSQSGKTIKQNTIISVGGCGVRIVGHKVIGNTAYITVQTFAAGRISGSGPNLKTVYKHLSKAYKTVSLKVPLSNSGHSKSKPLKVKLRVGFIPKKKGAHSASSVTVTFH